MSTVEYLKGAPLYGKLSWLYPQILKRLAIHSILLGTFVNNCSNIFIIIVPGLNPTRLFSLELTAKFGTAFDKH
jgi:hypothetical protein